MRPKPRAVGGCSGARRALIVGGSLCHPRGPADRPSVDRWRRAVKNSAKSPLVHHKRLGSPHRVVRLVLGLARHRRKEGLRRRTPLGAPPPAAGPHARAPGRILEIRDEPALLLVDNAVDADAVRPFLPAARPGAAEQPHLHLRARNRPSAGRLRSKGPQEFGITRTSLPSKSGLPKTCRPSYPSAPTTHERRAIKDLGCGQRNAKEAPRDT